MLRGIKSGGQKAIKELIEGRDEGGQIEILTFISKGGFLILRLVPSSGIRK